MKKVWSICFVGLVLTWLLALGALPASAYYPPLPATTTANSGDSSITFKVFNPQLNQNIEVTKPLTGAIEGSPVQQNGVIAWITMNSSGDVNGPVYGVSYAVYDPYLQTFKEGGEGPFTQKPEQLTVKDGIVAYVAATASSDLSAGYKVFHYATYDPVKGDWQDRTFVPMEATMPDFTVYDHEVIAQDGIVLMKYSTTLTLAGGSTLTSTELYADLYAAWDGKWLSEVALSIYVWGEQFPAVLKQYSIDKATIYYTWGHKDLPQTDKSETKGYDWWKEQNGWSPGSTKPVAYFSGQPYYGPNPLWVWFTDLSLGAASIEWSFGDGDTDTKRSTYHKYANDGLYLCGQKINTSGNSTRYLHIYVGIPPPSWFNAYASLASADDMTRLRQYRDKVLSKDPLGKVYKEQLYTNSEAALTVLTDNPELLLRARNLVEANMGAVIQVLQGHEGYIYNPGEVLAFLENCEELAPPQLQALINVVRKELRQSLREGKPFLGFRLGSDEPQQKNLPKPLKK